MFGYSFDEPPSWRPIGPKRKSAGLIDDGTNDTLNLGSFAFDPGGRIELRYH